MNHFSRLFAVSTLALAACTFASATPLTVPGSVVAAPITTTSSMVLANYSNVAFTSQAPMGQASTFSGTYNASVYRDSSNTLCGTIGSCLTFTMQISNNLGSSDGIETVTAGPFGAGFLYNVGYVAAAGQIAPLTISDNTFGALAFSFTTLASPLTFIAPGSTSDVLVIQTSATNYTVGSISVQDRQTATVAGFAPAATPIAVTPEPSSLVLLGTGLIGTATTLLRRRKLVA